MHILPGPFRTESARRLPLLTQVHCVVIGSLPSGRRRATRHLAGTAGMPNGQSWGRKRNATRPRPFPQATARRLVPGPRRTCRTPRRISQPVRVLLSPNRIRSVGSADSRRPGSTRSNSPAARTTRIAARGAVSSPRRVIAIGGRGRQLKIATGGGVIWQPSAGRRIVASAPATVLKHPNVKATRRAASRARLQDRISRASHRREPLRQCSKKA